MDKSSRSLKTVGALYAAIRQVLQEARQSAYRSVNSAMVQAYWRIGCLIVEGEQEGKSRAEYGQAVLAGISERLTAEFGKGYSVQNLRYMRQFYLQFQNRHALSGESPAYTADRSTGNGIVEKHHSVSGDFALGYLRPELSWTHYRMLLRVENEQARQWYMNEAADQNWSTRQLDRQISTLYCERLLASRDKTPVKQEASGKMAELDPEHFIRDPYVLEFLDLRDYPDLREASIEKAIIDRLQAFLLELGKGFSFVARQKRMSFDGEDFYVDLVFYNFILKCFVLIDLKIGKLTHQDIGQMDGYVRMFEAHFKVPEDNPTIGLILCSEKNEAIARYSVLHGNRQLFASKYMLYLPSEDALREELIRQRQWIEGKLQKQRSL